VVLDHSGVSIASKGKGEELTKNEIIYKKYWQTADSGNQKQSSAAA
jgi:hypothetical protein